MVKHGVLGPGGRHTASWRNYPFSDDGRLSRFQKDLTSSPGVSSDRRHGDVSDIPKLRGRDDRLDVARSTVSQSARWMTTAEGAAARYPPMAPVTSQESSRTTDPDIRDGWQIENSGSSRRTRSRCPSAMTNYQSRRRFQRRSVYWPNKLSETGFEGTIDSRPDAGP